MSEWFPIETAPRDGTVFRASRSLKRARKSGGQLFRAAQIFPRHRWEQFAGTWCPAFFNPAVWSKEPSDAPR